MSTIPQTDIPIQAKPDPVSRPSRPLLWWVALAAILAVVCVLSLRLITDFDLGFHLRGGQWMLQHRSFHHLDVFTYTVNQHEYIAMYWLFQIILYVVYAISGYAGLSLLTAFFIVAAFLLLLLRMRRLRVPPAWTAALLLACAFAMEVRFALRPEIMTWIYLLLMLFVLDGYNEGRHRQLFWLPVIQLFWTNSHGLFILGWFVVTAYFVSGWVHKRKADRTLLAWSACALLASFINPYYLKGIGFPFYLLTRLQTSSVFKDFITEFKSPWSVRPTANAPFFPSAPIYLYYAAVITSAAGLALTFKKRRLHEFLLWAGFGYLSSTAIRNVPLFIIVAAQIIAVSARDLTDSLRPKFKVLKDRIPNAVLPSAFTVLALLLALRVVTDAYYVADRRKIEFKLGLDRYAQGCGASDFILRHRLDTRILNDLNRGGWFIWALKQPVYIDGRLEVIQEGLFREYLASFEPGGLAVLIDKYQPQIIAFDYLPSIEWHYQLRQLPGWRLIYWDESSAIWARKDYAPDLPGLELIDVLPSLGIDTALTTDEADRILRHPTAPKFSRWLSGFYRHLPYPYELSKMGIFCYKNGYYREAGLCLLEFLRQTDAGLYEAYANLGAVFFWTGDNDRARYCYERVLVESPNNTLARNRLAEIRRKMQ